MTLYIATLGFDERFIMRFLLRSALRRNDGFIIVVPSDFMENEKSKVAYENLVTILKGYIKPENLNTFPVDYSDDLATQMGMLERVVAEKSAKDRNIIACLSGGMRILIVITLLALSRLATEGREVWVEIDFENLQGFSKLKLNPLLLPKDERILAILRIMEKGRFSVRRIGEMLGLSHATVYREISRMRTLGLVGRGHEITDAGKCYLKFWEGAEQRLM